MTATAKFTTRPATRPTVGALGTDHVYDALGQVVGTIDKLAKGRAALYVGGKRTLHRSYTVALRELHRRLG